MFSLQPVCLLFIASVTNYYKLSQLKQHKLILLQVYLLKVQCLSHCAKINVCHGLHFFLEAPKEVSLLSHFCRLPTFIDLWPLSPYSKSSMGRGGKVIPSQIAICLVYCGLEMFFMFKESWDQIGPTWIIQHTLPISISSIMITSAKIFYHVKSHSQNSRIELLL